MYAMVCTMPYIDHVVGVVSRFMANSRKSHWRTVKWIVWNLQGTTKKCLYFGKRELKVQDCVDSGFKTGVDYRSNKNYKTM